MHEAFLGAPGVAYDFTASAGLTQDRSGLTPVSAAAQNIGLAHDYSRASGGWVGQTERATNPGGPFVATTGWVGTGATVAIVGGELELTATGSGTFQANQSIATVTGRTYRITATARRGTCPQPVNIGFNGINSVSTNSTTNAEVSIVLTATSAATNLQLFSTSASVGNTLYLNVVSVREITGNPLIAPTDARRGTWATMPNGLPCLALNGTSHAYATAAAVNPGSNDEVHVWAAVRALANATQYIAESGPGSGDGTWVLLRVGGSGAYFAVSRGTQTLSGSSALCPAPNSSVLYQRSKISTPVLTLARNGITELTNTSTQGTGNYTSQIINIGARNATSPSLFFNGQIARLAVLYGPITTQQKTTIDGLVMQGFQTS